MRIPFRFPPPALASVLASGLAASVPALAADAASVGIGAPVPELGGMSVSEILPPALIRDERDQSALVGEDEGAFVIRLDPFGMRVETLPLIEFTTSIAKLDEARAGLEQAGGDAFEIDGQPCFQRVGQIAANLYCVVGDMTLNVLAVAAMFDEEAIARGAVEARALVETFPLAKLAAARPAALGAAPDAPPDPALGMAMPIPGTQGLTLAEALPHGARADSPNFQRSDGGFLISRIWDMAPVEGGGERMVRIDVFDWHDAAARIERDHAAADGGSEVPGAQLQTAVLTVGSAPCRAQPSESSARLECAFGRIVVALSTGKTLDDPGTDPASGSLGRLVDYAAGIGGDAIRAAQGL